MTELRDRLDAYLESCTTLSLELADALRDVRDTSSERKIYAADFSEIFAFAQPRRTEGEFRLFHDEDRQVAGLLQQVALERLFFNGEPVVLLEPYAIELEHNLRAWKVQAVVERAGGFPQAIELAGKLLEAEEFQEIGLVAHGVVHEGQSLSEAERSRIAEFFDEHAADLLNALYPPSLDRLDRLAALMDAKRLQGAPAEVDVDGLLPTSVPEWEWRLSPPRGRTEKMSRYLDAVALAQVQRINEILAPRGELLVLVTRSPTMIDAYRRWVVEEAKPESPRGWVRHPRVLATTLVATRTYGADAVAHLERRKEAVDRFLRVAKTAPDASAEDSFRAAFGEAFLEEIRRDRERASILQAYLSEVDGPRRLVSDRSHHAVELLALLQSDDGLQEVLRSKLDDVVRELVQDLEMGAWVRHFDASNLDKLRRTVRQERDGNKHLVRSTSYAMPYPLQFVSADGVGFALTFEFHPTHLNLDEAVEHLRHLATREARYERLLFMAFVFGCLGEWGHGLEYADEALEEAEQQSLLRHEGLFFKAVCLRKLELSVDGYSEATKLLTAAEADKEKRAALAADRGTDPSIFPSTPDPRYLTERAWHALGAIEIDDGSSPDLPSEEEAVGWLEKAREMSHDDPTLRVRILNLLLYQAAISQRPYERGIERLYSEFVELAETIWHSVDHWPGSLVHTRAWADWIMAGRGGGEAAVAVLDLLNTARRYPWLDNSQARIIDRDIREVQAAL